MYFIKAALFTFNTQKMTMEKVKSKLINKNTTLLMPLKQDTKTTKQQNGFAI